MMRGRRPRVVVEAIKNVKQYRALFSLSSSISSTLNSAAAVVFEDFLRPLPYFDRMSDAGQVGDLRYVVSKW